MLVHIDLLYSVYSIIAVASNFFSIAAVNELTENACVSCGHFYTFFFIVFSKRNVEKHRSMETFHRVVCWIYLKFENSCMYTATESGIRYAAEVTHCANVFCLVVFQFFILLFVVCTLSILVNVFLLHPFHAYSIANQQ